MAMLGVCVIPVFSCYLLELCVVLGSRKGKMTLFPREILPILFQMFNFASCDPTFSAAL